MATAEGVRIHARLRGADRLLWLDGTNAQLARRLLPESQWAFHGWSGSPTITELSVL